MNIRKTTLWVLLPFFILFSGCASSEYHISKVTPGIDIHTILASEFTRFFHIPEYPDSMNKGCFVYVEFPGRPFDLSDLSFSSLINIEADSEYINQAYRFSRMTGSIMERKDDAWTKSTKLLENILLENNIINRDIDMITSATYNEAFFPVYPNPAIRDSVGIWNYTHHGSIGVDSILVKNEFRHFECLQYTIKMQVSRINIEYGNRLTSLGETVGNSIAAITEIILVKSLEIIIYDNTIKVKRKRLMVIDRIALHITNGSPQIIGFIYTKI